MIRSRLLYLMPFVFAGCLQTRNDVKEAEQKQVMQRQVVDLQKTNADVSSRFSDIEEQLRYYNGRIESLENKISKNDNESDRAIKHQSDNLQDMSKKLTILQEALVKMETHVNQLGAEVESLKAEQAAQVTAAKEAAKKEKEEKKKDNYESGQEHFKQKEWKKAIIEFSKYRDKNPTGKHYADATYRIGVCFQELGEKDDAKTFYQEVVSRFPNSEEARRSKTRLKSLK